MNLMTTKLELILASQLPKDECWIYDGSTDKDGYPIAWHPLEKKTATGHRIAWNLTHGDVPEGMTLDHVADRGCTSRACVNPHHLEVVTIGENLRRAGTQVTTINHNKTHCPAGHPYDEANTSFTKQGWRQCRACARKRARQRRSGG